MAVAPENYEPARLLARDILAAQENEYYQQLQQLFSALSTVKAPRDLLSAEHWDDLPSDDEIHSVLRANDGDTRTAAEYLMLQDL